MKNTHITLIFLLLLIIALIIARLTIFILPEKETPTFVDDGEGTTIIKNN